MSLLKKINNFINFSAQRNFDSGIDIDATIKAKKEALANRSEEKPTEVKETKVEEKIAEPNVVEKVRQEVLTPVDAPKAELKQKSDLDRQKAELAELNSKLSEKKEEIAQTKKEIKEGEKETKEAEAIVEAEKVESGEDTPVEVASTEETVTEESKPEGATEESTTEETQEVAQDGTTEAKEETSEVAETESDSTPGTGGEAAAVASAEALAKKAEEEKEKPEEQPESPTEEQTAEKSATPDYNGAKVVAADGKNYTIVKREDGYYIRGTKSKVLDAEGNPTPKYRTLGNALINGQSVNDYVKSKGGWAKYNKELKSQSNG